MGLLGLAMGLSPPGFAVEEDVGLDWLFRLRGAIRPPSDVMIVSMDRTSSEVLGLPHDFRRWPRRLHARLVDTLVRLGASYIVFDVFFAEEQTPEDDGSLASAIGSASNVILFEYLRSDYLEVKGPSQTEQGALNFERFVTPLPCIGDAAVALAPFPLPKVPVKVTRYRRFMGRAEERPTMPLVAFQFGALDTYETFSMLFNTCVRSPSETIPRDGRALKSGRSMERIMVRVRRQFEVRPELTGCLMRELERLAAAGHEAMQVKVLRSLIEMYLDPGEQFLNFYGPPGTFAHIPFHALVETGDGPFGGQEMPDLRGKTVFVGACELMSVDNKDGFHTVFSLPSGLTLSGVEIAATAYANLLENRPVRPLSLPTHIAVIFLWGVLLGGLSMLLPAVLAFLSLVVGGLIFLAAASIQFSTSAVWCPIVIPVMFQPLLAFVGAVLWRFFTVSRERRQIRHAFGLYLPDHVVDQVVKDIHNDKVSERVVFGAVLCSDGARYSALSEAMAPRELSAFMNRYFETIFRSVHEYGGTVCDVVGDSMMALWSGAEPSSDLQVRSCLAALDIAQTVDRFNRLSETHRLHTRMGLHYGRISIGNVGGAGHYEYRAVGDVVNTSARIEGLNKKVGTQILVSEELLEQVDRFHSRRLGKFLFVGKTRPVVIHELVCPRDEATAEQRDLAVLFEEALLAYMDRNWEAALRRFREVLRINPNDGAALFYIGLCEACIIDPPDETWDGVVRLDSK
jgi:adenylate cyclase